MATAEDKRTAAQIVASLSSYLMTASLGVIAAQAVIVTSVLEKRVNLHWFIVISLLGAGASVASIYFGGDGVGELSARGSEGEWITRTSKGSFNRQALLCLVGLVFVTLSVFCGDTKHEESVALSECKELRTAVSDLRKEVADLKATTEASINAQTSRGTSKNATRSSASRK